MTRSASVPEVPIVEGLEHRYVLRSLHVDLQGRVAWPAGIRSNLPGADRPRVGGTLIRHMVPEQEREGWSVRLAVALRDPPQFPVRRSVVCPVAWKEGSPPRIGTATMTVEAGSPMPDRVPPRTARLARSTLPYRLALTVSPLGRVVDPRMPRSTGDSRVDQDLLMRSRPWTFLPELHDGLPVETRFETGPPRP